MSYKVWKFKADISQIMSLIDLEVAMRTVEIKQLCRSQFEPNKIL